MSSEAAHNIYNCRVNGEVTFFGDASRESADWPPTEEKRAGPTRITAAHFEASCDANSPYFGNSKPGTSSAILHVLYPFRPGASCVASGHPAFELNWS